MKNNYQNKCDFLVLTVSNKEQKDLYTELLNKSENSFGCKIIVTQDSDNGSRVGSGGAVINALSSVSQFCSYQDIPQKKVIVINSGGMSKRSFSYALRGKALITVKNHIEKALTTLDMIYNSAINMMKNVSSGLVICCSDILIDGENILFNENENSGICVKSDFVTGSRHGVMFADENGYLKEYFHKQPYDVLEKVSQQYGYNGEVLLDTGFVYFCPACTQKFINLIKNNNLKFTSEFSLYDDIIPAFASDLTEEKFLKDCSFDSNSYHIKRQVFDLLKTEKIKVLMDKSPFVHLGTSKEIIKNVSAISNGNTVFNSYISDTSIVSENSILDNCVLDGNCVVGDGCLICDVAISNITIADNTCVCGVKLHDGYFVTMYCDITENPKDINNSTELWYQKRFYKGFSYTDSLHQFFNSTDCEKISMDECFKQADYIHYSSFKEYISEKIIDSAQSKFNKEYSTQIITDYKNKLNNKLYLKPVKNSAVISMPVRVNFAGTWTDAAPYCLDWGGKVVNCSVLVDNKLPVTVTAEKLTTKELVLINEDSRECIHLNNFSCLSKIDEYSGFWLHRAALEVFGYSKDTQMTCGLSLCINVDKLIMKGSGLGISSIALSGCFRALAQLNGDVLTDKDVIEMTFVAEQFMGTGGGWQDQVGALPLGVKVSSSAKGIPQHVNVESIPLSDDFKKEFSNRVLILSTGQRHFGRFIVQKIVHDYYQLSDNTIDSLDSLKKLCDKAVQAFKASSLEKLSDCINQQQALLKELCSCVTDESIDKLVQECKAYADGVCICGAGAGGYLMVILKDGINADLFRKSINAKTHRLIICDN